MSTRTKPARFAVHITLRGKVTGRVFRYPDAVSPAEAIEKALAELSAARRGRLSSGLL